MTVVIDYPDQDTLTKAVQAASTGQGPPVTIDQPGPYGEQFITDGVLHIVGPYGETNWFAYCTVKDGVIVDVK